MWRDGARPAKGPRNYLRLHYMHAQVIASRGYSYSRVQSAGLSWPDSGGRTQPAGLGRPGSGGRAQPESPHTAYATASLLWSSAVPSMFDSVSHAEW